MDEDEDEGDDWNKPKNPDDYPDGWDEDLPDDWKYQKPKPVPLNKPQGFWGAGGGGNPWWGAPTPGMRWGDDPSGGYDPRTGMPKSTRGSIHYGGTAKIARDVQAKIDPILERYDKVRHPGRHLRRHILDQLSSHIPKTEAKKIMKDHDWL